MEYVYKNCKIHHIKSQITYLLEIESVGQENEIPQKESLNC